MRLTAKALEKIESAGKARKNVFDFVKQKWTTSSFSERVQLQRFAGRVLVRGTVGQQILGEFGEACRTCRSRGKIATQAAKDFYTKRQRTNRESVPKPDSKEDPLLTEDEADAE